MDKFKRHSGVAAALIRNNIDTDTIIPSREMKTVSKQGLASGLFAAWRYSDEKARALNPEFVLNIPPFDAATILLSGSNFGCGSSREHAVWALKEYGFKCIIAQSYGAIFYRNCIANGVLPLALKSQDIVDLVNNESHEIAVDLVRSTVTCGDVVFEFHLNGGDRTKLINGTDPIDATLEHSKEIQEFSVQDKKLRPWV